MSPDEPERVVSRETTPTSAAGVFGDRLTLAENYVSWLRTAGTQRGLIGPREADRLWSRHVLNCAVVAELIPADATVADVGSGAGLPGIPLALARPDLRVTLIEPLLRRHDFLSEVVADLALADRVEVIRARAEDLPGDRTFDVVTARAVAPMDRLARWTLPLVRPFGLLLAMKGEAVDEELRDSAALMETMGAESWTVERVGGSVVAPPTVVAVVRRGAVAVSSATAVRRQRGMQRRKRR